MDLDDVFLHFLDKFEALPKPSSAAEARITTDELRALTLWFSERWGMPRMWCESTRQVDLPKETSASRQEMFGALLVILASEVCRDKSNEDAVWPTVTAVLKADTISFPALFAGGQPTTACKKALAAGVRRLNLRNLIDRYGTQEYFDTLKLQFGFTLRGAVRRLPEWLDGLGPPIAVKILTGVECEYGDLKSTSFTKLWETLRDFRRSHVAEAYASAILQRSPWIRPEWTAELLSAAKLRSNRPFVAPPPTETPDLSSEPICEPILRWGDRSGPRLLLRLNDERIYEILGESGTATFAIDRKVIDRWTAQEGGGWHGMRELPCQPEGAKKPNLRPGLLSISSTEGKPLEEIDLFEMGVGEPLLIFDLKSGTPVDPASRLDPSRDYAFVCDTDLGIPGVNQCLKLKDRSAYRLTSPWPQDLRVVCDGILYWQPKIDDKEPFQPIHLILESPPGEVAEIGSASNIQVAGVPDDATAVTLITGHSFHSVTKHGAVWRTEHRVPVTLGMVLGAERVRVRLTGSGYARTVVPKLSLNLWGIACIEPDSNNDGEPEWRLSDRKRPLNRADGSGRARIFVKARSHLYEGPCLLGKITSRTLPLRDLHGWGYPLLVNSEDRSESVLVDSVEDRGCLSLYVPSLLGKPLNELHFRTPVPLSLDHEVLVWSSMPESPRRVGGKEITSCSDGFIWKLPDLGPVEAMAVVYQGARMASYWAPQPIISALRPAPSAKLFALFRWLKLPVMSRSFKPPMQEAVLRAPQEFVTGWLADDALQCGLVHRQAEQGLDVVIREFLWSHVERNDAKMDRLARAFPKPSPEAGSQSESEAFKSLVSRLGEICPSLAYTFARQKIRGDKYRKYVRAVAATMLRQSETADVSQLRNPLIDARRDCANLMGISPETLESSVSAFGAYLDNQTSNYKQVELDLRKLGETTRGRQFLTAWLLIRLVERIRF